MNRYDWSELGLGLRAAFWVDVTPGMLDDFRRLTGDVNPLHLDDAYASAQGFSGRVVYGLLTTSLWSRLAGVYLPGERCLLHGVSATFHRPVYVGDRLDVAGEVSYRNEAMRQAEIACRVTNQRGERVSTGKLKVGLR
jgi:3-hydroxybutyryl-CoA dehydratase